MSLNDHELTVLVEAAASGVVNTQASLRGGKGWDDLSGDQKGDVREIALPFIYHGTKALEDLGYRKAQTVFTDAELDELPVGARVWDVDGEIYEKGDLVIDANHWLVIGTDRHYTQAAIHLPATIVRGGQ